MRFGLALAALIMWIPTHGIAEVTRVQVCERAGITRIVELQSEDKTGLPCRVIYKRPMEDKSATSLWNAETDVSYCVRKYDEFVAKIEKKHSWSCTAELPAPSSIPAASTANPTVPESTTFSVSPTDSGLLPPEATLKESKNTSSVTTRDNIAIRLSNDTLAEPLAINPGRNSALLVDESDRGLSMTLIRQLIPSGKYVVNDEITHSGNAALCPADGFFIWSTKRPGKPAFEMGTDKSFQFDLGQVSDEPLLAGADSAINRLCHEEVATGYCSDNVYNGSTALHPQLSRYFGCGSNSGNTAQRGSLVLFRSSVNQTESTSACRTTPAPQHMALAPAGDPEAINEKRLANGIELVILTNQSKSAAITDQDGAICRYVRG